MSRDVRDETRQGFFLANTSVCEKNGNLFDRLRFSTIPPAILILGLRRSNKFPAYTQGLLPIVLLQYVSMVWYFLQIDYYYYFIFLSVN